MCADDIFDSFDQVFIKPSERSEFDWQFDVMMQFAMGIIDNLFSYL